MTLPAHVERLGALLCQALGLDMRNGQLILNFGEGRLLTIDHKSSFRVARLDKDDGSVHS